MSMHSLQPIKGYYGVCWLNDLCMRTGLALRLPFAKSEQVYGLATDFSYYNYRNLHPDNNIAVHHISHRSGTRTWISYDVLHEGYILKTTCAILHQNSKMILVHQMLLREHIYLMHCA